MSDFVQVLRLDAQFRSRGTGSDFQIELPENLSTTQNTHCHVSAVSFPATVWTIEEGINDKLYVSMVYIHDAGSTQEDKIITIKAQQYDAPTFATELQTKLNAAMSDPINYPAFAVQWNPADNNFDINWGSTDTPLRQWRIWSEAQLATVSWTGPSFDRTDPKSCQNVIRLEAEPSWVFQKSKYTTGHFDAQADYHVLYLHSNLSSWQSSGPRMGDRDVICRVPLDVGYGYYMHWQEQGTAKYFPVPAMQLKNLTFRLTDAKGNTIDLHGGNVSVELYFSDFAH